MADPHVCPGSVPGPAPTVPYQYKRSYISPELLNARQDYSEGYAAGVAAAQQQVLDSLQVQQSAGGRSQTGRDTGVINASARSN